MLAGLAMLAGEHFLKWGYNPGHSLMLTTI